MTIYLLLSLLADVVKHVQPAIALYPLELFNTILSSTLLLWNPSLILRGIPAVFKHAVVQLIIKKKEIWTISTFILTKLLDLTAAFDTVDHTILLLSWTMHRDQVLL